MIADHDKIKKSLISLGLCAKEVDIYLSCLSLGICNISQLAKAAKIKRPTVYLIIEQLINKKFIERISNKSFRPLYKAYDPQSILQNLNCKLTDFASCFKDLDVISNTDHAPVIKIYEGIEGLKIVYKEIVLTSIKNEVLIYGTISNHKMPENNTILSYWLKLINNKKVKIREIIDYNDHSIKYYKQIVKLKNSNHIIKAIPKSFKFLPNKMKILDGDNIIYSNNVAFFCEYSSKPYVLVITHKTTSDIYKNLFEMSWEIADKF